MVAPTAAAVIARALTPRGPGSGSGASSRLRHDVDQVRLAALHHVDATTDGGRQIPGIGNRTRRADAEALRQRGEVDVRIAQAESGVKALGAAMAQQRLPL